MYGHTVTTMSLTYIYIYKKNMFKQWRQMLRVLCNTTKQKQINKSKRNKVVASVLCTMQTLLNALFRLTHTQQNLT